MPDEFSIRVQRLAEEHLAACNDAFLAEQDDQEVASPAYGPYDGCDTCVVREILSVTWEEMLDEARREVREQ